MKAIARSGRAQKLLIYIRSSLWFMPSLIIFGAIALSIGLVEIDRHFDQELRQWSPRLFAIEAEGARSMLSTIAGAMATVAGVVFSIMIVALSLASTQYTSRVLRNFMRDRVNQVMLGVFVGVYLYCLFLLRTISGGDGAFVPAIAVSTALLLTIFASGFFIFFIHHVSSTIQASEMAAAITREALQAVDILFPEEVGEEGPEKPAPASDPGTKWYGIPASDIGYVQSVDSDALIEFARNYGTIVRMECEIGDFVAQDRPLVSLALYQPPDAGMAKALNEIYAIDTYRTIEQDAAFGIRQLVDMSLKALSPGINDTTTAVTCIEHISVILTRCAPRPIAPRYRYEGNTLRVIAARPDFARLVALGFNQIRENAAGNTEIMLRLLSAIEQIGLATRDSGRLDVLRRQVKAIEETSRKTIESSDSMDEIAAKLGHVRQLLDAKKES